MRGATAPRLQPSSIVAPGHQPHRRSRAVSHAVLSGRPLALAARGHLHGALEIWPSPGATAVETWGAVLRARARLGAPRSHSPAGKFPANHTSVAIRTHQLRSSPGVRLGFAAPRQQRLLAPPAHRCQLDVELGRHAGHPWRAGNLPTGPAKPTHMTKARARIRCSALVPPFTRAVLARRSPRLAQPSPQGGSTGGVLLTRSPTDLWPPGASWWRHDHDGQPQRSIGRPPTRRSPAQAGRPRAHHPITQAAVPPTQAPRRQITRPASHPAQPRPTAFAQLDQRQVGRTRHDSRRRSARTVADASARERRPADGARARPINRG